MKKEKINYVSYFFQLVAGIILVIAAVPKLMGSPESVALFTELGIDSSRFIIGLIECFAALLMLVNYLPQIGALLSFGVMCGAILAHLTKIGIVVNGDGGALFGMLLAVATSSLIVLWLQRHKIPLIGHTIKK